MHAPHPKLNGLRRREAIVALVFGCLSLCPSNALALALAQSSLSFSNLSITSGSGVLSFFDPWSAEAFADADGFGVFDATFDGATTALASSSSTFATASASANPLQLTGVASSSVNIPDGVAASSFGTGRSSLYNTFIVTGGTGSVNVTFSAALAGNLNVLTNNVGVSARTETVFALELDGSSVLFKFDVLSIGPNSAQSLSIATTLTASRTLLFDTPYFVFVEADSESRAVTTVPDSSTALGDGVTFVLISLTCFLFRRHALAVGARAS